MQNIFFTTFFILLATNMKASIAIPLSMPKDAIDTVGHGALDTLLVQYVNDAGKVDYQGLRTQKKALAAYCQLMSNHPPQESWSKEAQMAYWINAYNANTLLLMVEHYPLKSILDLDGGKTWDVQRVSVGNKKFSLNDLENKILRPIFKDPRIHFAINCAAQSCPPLWNRAYTAGNITSTLEKQTRAFIGNPIYNTFTAKKARISKIFEWYSSDFGDLTSFLNRYGANLNSRAVVHFNAYDWSLNAAQ